MEGIKMSLEFNASEIMEMAIQIEKNGQKFYKKAAQIVSSDKARKLLLDLAAMEVKHEKIFKEMKSQLSQNEQRQVTFDPEDEASDYLRAMADGHVFKYDTDYSAMLTGKETIEQIFTTAIQVEKDSIVFYVGLRDYVPPETGREKIEQVIKEEKSHIIAISRNIRQYR